MADLSGFNAHEIEPYDDYDLIPPGKYVCVITQSELKPTKNGDGEYLQFEFEIVEGEHQGRRLWDRIIRSHPSDRAVQVGRRKLSSICRAVDVMTPRNSAELHNKPLLVSVDVKPRSDNGQNANVIKGYGKASPAGQPLPTPAPAASGAQNPANGSTPPWLRNR